MKLGFNNAIFMYQQVVNANGVGHTVANLGTVTGNTTVDTSFIQEEPILFVGASHINVYIVTRTRVFTTFSSELKSIMGPVVSMNSNNWF